MTTKPILQIAALVVFGAVGVGSVQLTAEPASASPAPAAQSAAVTFSSKCASCHNGDGTGKIAGTPNFTDAAWQASRSDAQLANSIKNGKGSIMPAWGKQFSDAQIAALVAHVRKFKK
jgi:cytochrome c oxidase cbb3-type subunit 3